MTRVLTHVGEEFTCSIVGCARCHGEGHEDVVWQPLTHPFEMPDGDVMTHWAPCPTNGQPILMVSYKIEETET
jgi:hypothetical protein